MKILILAGGRGTRLWPLSRLHKPKQFQKLFGGKTMLEATLERVLPIASLQDIYVATSHFYKEEVKKQLPRLASKNIILEPAFRERVAAFLLFLCYLKKDDLRRPIVILPSDHLIKDEEKFWQGLLAGAEFVKKHPERILLFGERPSSPDTGLGYIQKGAKIADLSLPGNVATSRELRVFEVKHFKEKPNLKRAKEYLNARNYFWNAGMFIFMPVLFEKLVKEFVPDNHRRYLRIKKAFGSRDFKNVLQKEYSEMDSVSFDHSILENYRKNVVLPIDMGWSDIGSWAVLKNCLTDSEAQNYIKGNYLGVKSKNIMVYGESSQLVAACGIKDLIIVATNDVIFICKKDKSQDVKGLIEQMEKTGKKEYL